MLVESNDFSDRHARVVDCAGNTGRACADCVAFTPNLVVGVEGLRSALMATVAWPGASGGVPPARGEQGIPAPLPRPVVKILCRSASSAGGMPPGSVAHWLRSRNKFAGFDAGVALGAPEPM